MGTISEKKKLLIKLARKSNYSVIRLIIWDEKIRKLKLLLRVKIEITVAQFHAFQIARDLRIDC